MLNVFLCDVIIYALPHYIYKTKVIFKRMYTKHTLIFL